MNQFKNGYSYYEKSVTSNLGAQLGSEYVTNIDNSIESLIKDLNAFKGFKTNNGALKGDIAEFWHSGTFNINASLNGSQNRTYVDRSHDFASADITSNFGHSYGLKYYKNGILSAKAQSVSMFERYSDYKAKGGVDSLDTFLTKRGYTNADSILNDPIYSGQVRIIPKDQMDNAIKWLKQKIQQESVKRPEQLKRYQETLSLLQDRIKDRKGNESIPLSKDEAEKLAELAKQGKIDAKDLGLTTEELVNYEYILQQGFRAGLTSATISMVLRIAPEIFRTIEYILKNGDIDVNQFKKIGFQALNGATEGFIRGSVSASITTACKAGLLGEAYKNINPSIVGTITVLVMDTMKNSFKVATGKMSNRELANDLIKEMFVSTCSLVVGGVGQAMIELPVLGFMIGSFVGSMVGSFAYTCGYRAVLSFCIDTGFTMFGLVDQDYRLPMEIMKDIGIDVFEYDKFEYPEFEYDKFEYDKFEYNKFEYTKLEIIFLRRGVIGVSQIGYI